MPINLSQLTCYESRYKRDKMASYLCHKNCNPGDPCQDPDIAQRVLSLGIEVA